MKKIVAGIALMSAMFMGAGVAQAGPNVPNVVGLSQTQAYEVLDNAGVPYRVNSILGSAARGDCLVVAQNTRGNERVRVGTTLNSRGNLVGVYETQSRGVGLAIRC